MLLKFDEAGLSIVCFESKKSHIGNVVGTYKFCISKDMIRFRFQIGTGQPISCHISYREPPANSVETLRGEKNFCYVHCLTGLGLTLTKLWDRRRRYKSSMWLIPNVCVKLNDVTRFDVNSNSMFNTFKIWRHLRRLWSCFEPRPSLTPQQKKTSTDFTETEFT